MWFLIPSSIITLLFSILFETENIDYEERSTGSRNIKQMAKYRDGTHAINIRSSKHYFRCESLKWTYSWITFDSEIWQKLDFSIINYHAHRELSWTLPENDRPLAFTILQLQACACGCLRRPKGLSKHRCWLTMLSSPHNAEFGFPTNIVFKESSIKMDKNLPFL